MTLWEIYILALGVSYLSIWIRHFYLVYQLYIYLKHQHEAEIAIYMRNNPNRFGLEYWPTSDIFKFYQRGMYNFVWRSAENYNDPMIIVMRHRIRRFVVELPLFLVTVISITAILIYLFHSK